MRLIRIILLLFLAEAALPAVALADKRIALLIGNATYAAAARLYNPPNDVAALKTAFEAAGFDAVEAVQDLGREAMIKQLRAFEDEAADADIAVIYYSGHGLEMGGENYLVPVDARLASDRDVKDETVSLERLLEAIDGARRLKLVILDACRNNPFLAGMAVTNKTRAIDRGLARIEPASADLLVAFAAKAGSVAEDGDLDTSPFAAALARRLGEPGVDVQFTLREVRDDVLAATDRKQEPFVYGTIGGMVTPLSKVAALPQPAAPLAAAPPAPSPPPAATRSFLEAQNDGYHWKRLEGETVPFWAAAVSPDFKLLTLSGPDKTVDLWSLETGQRLKVLNGFPSGVEALRFSPDGGAIAAGLANTEDGKTQSDEIWDVAGGKPVWTVHDSEVDQFRSAFSPDGRFLATLEVGENIVLWDVATRQRLRTVAQNVAFASTLGISADDKVLAVGRGYDQPVADVYSLDGEKTVVTRAKATVKTGTVAALVLSPDGKTMFTLMPEEGFVSQWDVHTGKRLRTVSTGKSGCTVLALSPDGRTLAAGGNDGSLFMWDTGDGHILLQMEKLSHPVLAVAFSPDGTRFVAVGNDGAVVFRDVGTGVWPRTLYLSQDGGVLDFDSDDVLRAVTGEEDSLYAFNKDGQVIKPSNLRRFGYALPVPKPVTAAAGGD